MHTKTIVLALSVLLPQVMCLSENLKRKQVEALSRTRCDLVCNEFEGQKRTQCRKQCRLHQQKPGTCPASDNPNWAPACLKTCVNDAQCEGTLRCCHHGCGSACSEPIDLLSLPGLPPVPVLEEPKEKRRAVIVKWSGGVGDSARSVPGRVLYLIAEQHHLGPKYEENRLGKWNLIHRTNKTSVALRNLLKPGRWYRFRVAAVSAAGTRGFSQPSPPFTVRKGPRPPQAPKDLTVQQLTAYNGKITVRLGWRSARSDLPLVQYKVFWSRRVRGVGGDLDSVLVDHQTVPKDKNFLDIEGLLPNSMYFFQVQTISQFGNGKLRSSKSAVFYNTTSEDGAKHSSGPHDNRQRAETAPQALREKSPSVSNVTGLKLITFVWLHQSLLARISWDSEQNSDKKERFNVSWKSMGCANNKNSSTDLSAVTQKNTFDIYEINFECKYRVKVNKYTGSAWLTGLLTSESTNDNSEIIIQVPKCTYIEDKLKNKLRGFKCPVE